VLLAGPVAKDAAAESWPAILTNQHRKVTGANEKIWSSFLKINNATCMHYVNLDQFCTSITS
jgi:hypothetical protein